MHRHEASLLIFCLLTLFSCHGDNKLSGAYKAFYYESFWQLTLKDNAQFVFETEGHVGNSKVEGRYIVSADTVILLDVELDSDMFLIDSAGCLVDIETRFDYCKSWPDEWGSTKKNINYPQLKTTNEKLKQDVEWMLQQALQNKEILKYFPDTTKNLIIQEYYEINKEANLDLKWYGNPIIFLSDKEIKSKGIKEYLIIDEINVGLKSAMVDLQVMPIFYIGILDFFQKEKGRWVHRN